MIILNIKVCIWWFICDCDNIYTIYNVYDVIKGEWKAKRIPNPDYKGPWEHPEIDNPDYVEAKDVYKRGAIGYVGVEVWQVKAGTVFSDFILSDSLEEAEAFLNERKTNEDDEKSAKEAYDEAQKPAEEESDDEGSEETEEDDHDEL